jgi:ribosomal protein S18 acetylase RimI-like enzyme
MSPRADVTITSLDDKAELSRLISESWGADVLVMGGMRYTSETLDAFAARDQEGAILGFITWTQRGPTVLVLSLNSLVEGAGVGERLLYEVVARARKAAARTVRVMTTNDNTAALVYYQRRGFRMTALYAGAIDAYRAMNPKLRPTGFNSIPVRDAIELEMDL